MNKQDQKIQQLEIELEKTKEEKEALEILLEEKSIITKSEITTKIELMKSQK